MFFSIITKNLNWGILTKNLVTFKRWDWVRMKNFNILGGSPKNMIFTGGSQKKQYTGGNCLKRKAWTVCRFKRRLYKKEGVVFLRGGTPQCTLFRVWKGYGMQCHIEAIWETSMLVWAPKPWHSKNTFQAFFLL